MTRSRSAPTTPEGEERAEETGPKGEHRDLLVGQQARPVAFAGGCCGGAHADERFGDPGPPCGASPHEAQDAEGHRLAALSRDLGHALAQRARPLAPPAHRCVPTGERSFPMKRGFGSCMGIGNAFSWLHSPSALVLKKVSGKEVWLLGAAGAATAAGRVGAVVFVGQLHLRRRGIVAVVADFRAALPLLALVLPAPAVWRPGAIAIAAIAIAAIAIAAIAIAAIAIAAIAIAAIAIAAIAIAPGALFGVGG